MNQDEKLDEIINSFGVEHNIRKLQGLAIEASGILKEEIRREELKCAFFEARIYNIKTVGVQGDKRTYGHPAEITLMEPKHADGRAYTSDEIYDFLEIVSTRITNEIEELNKVLYVTATRDERSNLFQ